MLQCYMCGAPVRPGARFCSSCGRPQLLNERYRLRGLLGKGGFAVVYDAEDLRLARRCAIKALPVSTADEQRQAEAEASILSANASQLPFIPDIYDFWSVAGQTYLVMEYIEGATLDDLATPWPLAEVERFFQTLLTALEQLHAAGIVHRDLKPANIKRTPRGYVLLDFGIAKQGHTTMRVAQAASLDYAPLEQLRNQPTDQRADLYSLAATTYFLLSGAGPPPADARLLGAGLTAPSRFAPQLTPALEAALLRMLALDPADRPPSARAVLDSLAVSGGPAPVRPPSSAGQATTRLAAGPSTPPSTTTTPEQVLVVAQDGSGDYTTIGAAISAAPAGARILVRPGRYEEGLRLDRPLEIVGEGPREAIEVVSYNADALLMACDTATVRGLTLRCMAGEGGGKFFGVDIARGRLQLEDCVISSDSLACVAIHSHLADPVLVRCLIHSGAQGGVYAYNSAAGLLDGCEIAGNSLAGIEITSGASTIVRRCLIRDGKQSGVYVWGNAEGLIEDCEIAGNQRSNILIKQGGAPTMRRCMIHSSQQSGVFVNEHGGGLIEACTIFANAYAGLAIARHANPLVRNCILRDGQESGVFVYEEGAGVIESCEVLGNRTSGVSVIEQANPIMRNCRIHGNQQSGVSVSGGLGLFEACEIYDNALGGLSVSRNGNPMVRGCRIHSGRQGGVLSYNEGLGTLEECAIFGNRYAGVEIREGGAITVRRCRIYDGQTSGLQVSEGGSGLIEECELYGNAVAGVMIMREGRPTMRRSTIRANRQNGVTIDAQGTGHLEECQIVENNLAGIEFKGGSGAVLGCTISRNRFQAVYAHSKAEATISGCDLRGNGRGAWLITGEASLTRSANQE